MLDTLDFIAEVGLGYASRRMFARCTDQGTAMSETAQCSDCIEPCEGYEDCTGNDQLSCQSCGWEARRD